MAADRHRGALCGDLAEAASPRPMLIVTFVIVTGFGAMTIYLQDPIFIFIKPTDHQFSSLPS